MRKQIETSEYNPYYSTYINSVPEGNIVHVLTEQLKETVTLLAGISDTQAHFQYAPDKWSIKEVLGHVADTERIMSYRLLCIARGETASLPGFDENMYVLRASFNKQSMQDLLANFNAVRQSTLQLLKSLEPEAWLQRGTANGSEFTVRALASIIAGHELHHRRIIKERYISSDAYPSS